MRFRACAVLQIHQITKAMPKTATLTSGKPKRGGAGSKKTPAAIERGLAVAREGLPLRFVAGAMGVTFETLCQWRKDPEFAQALESARTEGVLLKWGQIKKAAEKNPSNSWSAIAWLLERGFPSEFGRPEVQLGLTVNNQTTNNTLIITTEAAEKLSARAKPVEAEVDVLVEAHQAKMKSRAETGRDQIREVESTLMPSGAASGTSGAIILPPADQRHVNWWAMLSRGDGHRPITPEAAEYIIKAVAVDALGAQRASGLKISLDDPSLSLRDVWDAIADVCGPSGWASLTRRGQG
jgi:hypothetical protein